MLPGSDDDLPAKRDGASLPRLCTITIGLVGHRVRSIRTDFPLDKAKDNDNEELAASYRNSVRLSTSPPEQ